MVATPLPVIRLQAMKRELRIRELQLLDGAKRKFMHHQQAQKEAELSRLDDEIARKVGTCPSKSSS